MQNLDYSKKNVCYGTGKMLEKFLNKFPHIKVEYLIDSNPQKQNTIIYDHKVFSTDVLKSEDKQQINVIITSQFYEEISATLEHLGFEFKKNYFIWADELNIIPKKYIASFLPANPVILEAGGHIGADTKELSSVFSTAKIYSFEPVPAIYEQLNNNTADLANVVTFNTAISNVTSTHDMYISEGRSNASSSLLQPKEHLTIHPDVLFNEKLVVNTIRLDEWMKNENVDHIDFMWLDLQGAELLALEGLGHHINSVKLIYMEVALVEQYDGAPIYETVKNVMDNYGFKVLKEEFKHLDLNNVLFINKQYYESNKDSFNVVFDL